MIFYLFILFILILFSIKANNNSVKGKSNKFLTISIGLFFIFICGLRSNIVGNDTEKYLELYDSINFSSSDIYFERFESGFIYLVKFLGGFNLSSQSLLIISSIIIWSGIIRFLLKNSINPGFSYYLIVTFGFLAFFMSGIRESLAISICLIGFEYVKSKKIIPFIILILLASSFHLSALIFIFIYPAFHARFRLRTKIMIIFSSIIIMKYINIIMLYVIRYIPKYASYLNTVYNNGIIRVASILNLLIVLVIYILGKIYNDKLKNYTYDGYLNIFFMSIPLLIVSLNFNLIDRLANYYDIFILIIIPNIIANRNNKNNKIISIIVIIAFLIYFISIQLIRPDWNSIYPYKFYWM